MRWMADHWFLLTLLAAYSALMIHHAIIGRRRTRGTVDYYVGGRALGGGALGLSFFATYSSTNSFVGFSGQAYTYGVPWLLLAPSAVLFCLLAWLWIAPRLRRFTERLDSITLPDFIGFRFESRTARGGAALIVLFASFLYMTAVFKGIGNLLETFLDIHYLLAIALVFVVVVAYTAVGGFISVVRTDVIQGVVMIAAAVLLFGGTVRAAGGFDAFGTVQQLPGRETLFTWEAAMPFPVLIGIIVAGTMKFLVEPRQLSRFYALRDDRAVTRGMWTSTSAFLVVYALLVPIGIFAHHLIPGGIDDTDLVVPTLLANGEIFVPAVGAFLLVAMIAAAMSSLDSVLLVMASTCQRDVVELVRPALSGDKALLATRLYVVVFAFVTALIAIDPPGQSVTLTAFSGSLYAACFFPSIVFGLHWTRGNGLAAVASMAIGLLTLLLWPLFPVGDVVHEVFPALAFSTVAFGVVAAMSEPVTSGTVRALFVETE
jgi:SSS family transporter